MAYTVVSVGPYMFTTRGGAPDQPSRNRAITPTSTLSPANTK
ncbi:hypothetical protein [Amycolatopsis sp. La24]|nr:hypothetical protein [Amycolatopsis sp. La24]